MVEYKLRDIVFSNIILICI